MIVSYTTNCNQTFQFQIVIDHDHLPQFAEVTSYRTVGNGSARVCHLPSTTYTSSINLTSVKAKGTPSGFRMIGHYCYGILMAWIESNCDMNKILSTSCLLVFTRSVKFGFSQIPQWRCEFPFPVPAPYPDLYTFFQGNFVKQSQQ